MKFLCLADSQFGVTTVELGSQEKVWDQVVTLAIENEVSGMLHAGDLFEYAHVDAQVYAAFRRPLARLRDAGVPMLLIRGNHDGAVRPVDALDVFHEYEMLTVSQRPELVEIGGAIVVTLPWVSPKHLVAASNGASRENVYEAASEMLVGIARDLLAQARAKSEDWGFNGRDWVNYPDRPVVLLLHWSVSGASLPTGLPVDQLHEPILPWPDLDALGFDAVVCGHIHKLQALPQIGDTLGFYCGSPQQLNHGETGAHGVCMLQIYSSDGEAVADFLPIESPRFVTVDLDPGQVESDTLDAVLYGVASGDVVRVRYASTREEDARIDKDAIRRELLAAGASRVTIEPNIIREARARAEHLTESLTELDALSAYCEAQGIDAGMRDRMIERTGEWL